MIVPRSEDPLNSFPPRLDAPFSHPQFVSATSFTAMMSGSAPEEPVDAETAPDSGPATAVPADEKTTIEPVSEAVETEDGEEEITLEEWVEQEDQLVKVRFGKDAWKWWRRVVTNEKGVSVFPAMALIGSCRGSAAKV